MPRINNYELINLTVQGTNIQDHYSVLSKIPDNANHIYVLSIKVHDIEKRLIKNQSPNQNPNQNISTKTITQKGIQLLATSDVMCFLKDILHHVFMYLYHTPAPNTHVNKMILYPDDDRLKDLGFFYLI